MSTPDASLNRSPAILPNCALDVAWAREQFPSLGLRVGELPVAYFDNPAGTQVPRQVERAVQAYFAQANANTHGQFLTSRRTDAVVERARLMSAAFLGARAPEEIVFGPNMTTLTHALSQALGRTWVAGDELLVSDLDHDANISPWLDLEERGVRIIRIPIHVSTGTLDLDALGRSLSERTRLVAVGYASNALGTVNDVRRVSELAHAAGARVWVDAVHFAPHGPIDVQALDIDFLVCSAYKFFGPHVGILWGRHELLEALPARRIRPAPRLAPEKFESGTKSHEGLAGLVGAFEYLGALGAGSPHAVPFGDPISGTDLPTLAEARAALRPAMSAIAAYESQLAAELCAGLTSLRGVRVYGPSAPDALGGRVPTFGFTLAGIDNQEVARRLGERGIFVWAGHHYALTLMDRLGLGEAGVVRVGAVHYNTRDEVARLLECLADLTAS